MFTRRKFSLTMGAMLATPSLQSAKAADTDALRSAAAGLAQLHSILVQRGDDVLLAYAPRGRGLKRHTNIKSCSKSVLALLLGSAIERGEISGLSTRLGDVAAALIPHDATPGVEDLTMLDLVTLRAGLQSTSGRNYGAWVSSRNWVSAVLRQPRIEPAGGRMIYSTGTTHVLGAALSIATGESLLAQARERLGLPLQIEIPPWTRDPQGFYFGGNEMALTPEAMLRVAVLMREGGRADGLQIISTDWVRRSTQPQTRSQFSGLGYGLGWFISPSGWLIARGFGGQIIAANAAMNLAVAITSDSTQPARSQGHFGDLMALIDGPVSDLA